MSGCITERIGGVYKTTCPNGSSVTRDSESFTVSDGQTSRSFPIGTGMPAWVRAQNAANTQEGIIGKFFESGENLKKS